MTYRKTFIGLAILLLAPPLQATTFTTVTKTCPVGGEKFEAMEIMSYSSFGERPDGRSYGTLPVYPLVVCPKNDFVIFEEEFTKSELKTLADAVASPEYQALVQSEVPFYRAYWLSGKIGRSTALQANLLMQAGWDSDDDAERKRRYQAEFALLTACLDQSGDDTETFWLSLRGTNALRELGKFEEAALRLAKLKGAPNFPTDENQKDGATKLIEGLSELIVEQNGASEPTNLIPPEFAIARCDSKFPMGAAEIKACKTVRATVVAEDSDAAVSAADALYSAEEATAVVEPKSH